MGVTEQYEACWSVVPKKVPYLRKETYGLIGICLTVRPVVTGWWRQVIGAAHCPAARRTWKHRSPIFDLNEAAAAQRAADLRSNGSDFTGLRPRRV